MIMNYMEDANGVVHGVAQDLMSAPTECGAGTVESLDLHETGDAPTCEGCRAAMPVTCVLEDQGVLQPGQDGYWPVHGARVADIRSGDLVMARGSEGPTREYVITEAIPPDGGMADGCAPRFVTSAGDTIRLGHLMAVAISRKGTHRTLADSI
jgi:hypothetical protein